MDLIKSTGVTMAKRCLLLKFPDSREVFTSEKYYNSLLELSKSFGVKIMTVEADNPSLLKIKDIAQIFCDQNKDPLVTCSYRIVPQTAKSDLGIREKMLQKVSDVRSYIENQFIEGNVVRIKELHHKFQKHNIAVSTLYRHLSYVKEKLESENKKIIKINTGCYKIA